MAITSDALQTALGVGARDARVLRAYEPSQGTQQQWLVDGRGVVNRVRMVVTTAADNAATQAAAVLAALRA